jgi:hypothetical protein
MKKIILAAVVMGFTTGSVFANQCPGLIKKIDDAMASATVDEATMTKVKELRDAAQASHDAGDHAASEAGANEAIKLLGI